MQDDDADEPGLSEEEESAGVLTISPEKVCFVIVKAREFDVKDAVTEEDPGSNPTDDKETAVLEDHEDDPVVEELSGFIDALTEDEQIDLVALAWLHMARGTTSANRYGSAPGRSGFSCIERPPAAVGRAAAR